jgi:hypothetical protein
MKKHFSVTNKQAGLSCICLIFAIISYVIMHSKADPTLRLIYNVGLAILSYTVYANFSEQIGSMLKKNLFKTKKT